jgi:hypothetical protein
MAWAARKRTIRKLFGNWYFVGFMLIAIVFFSILITTAAAFVMKKQGVRRPMVWMVMAVSSLILWLMVMLIDPGKGVALNWQNWFYSSGSHIGLYFLIGKQNWAVIGALLTVHVAFLFTSGARQEFGKDFILWIVEAVEIALTFAILTAADLWSLVFTWTAMDACLFMYWSFFRKVPDHEKIFRTFIIKFAGSILLIFATAQISGKGESLYLANIPAASSTLVFLAALLHSGIFPLNIIKNRKIDHQSVLDLLSFLLPLFSSLNLITYLPNNQLSFIVGLISSVAALAAIIYFALLWLKARDELEALCQFALSFSAFAAYCFLTKTQNTLQDWFIILILYCPWMLLHDRRGRATNFFPIILLVLISGLPFSLTSYGSSGFSVSEFSIPVLVAILFHILFLVGYVRFIFLPKGEFDELESSSQMVYFIGLFITILSLGALIFRTMGSLSDEISGIWAGLFIAIVVLGFFLWNRSRNKPLFSENQLNKLDSARAEKILTFAWLFNVTDTIMSWCRPLVTGFSQLLEGEGGVIWSMVLLAMLVTLLKSG